MTRRRATLAALAALVLAPAAAQAAPAGSTLLVSRPDGLGPVLPNFDSGSSGFAPVSADGRYVAFVSSSDGFASGADPRVLNVFVRDTQAATTTLVSRSDGLAGAGASLDASDPAIAVTSDGHVLVAFVSAASLVDHPSGAPVATGGQSQIWLRDVTAGTTTLISRAGGGPGVGAVADGFTSDPSIDVSAGGPVVAFSSGASNLGSTNGGVFLRTVDAGATQLVSCAALNCAGGVGASAAHPAVRVMPSVAGTRCAGPAHTTPCVVVAFSTPDASITGDAGAHRQIVVATATAPAMPGGAPGASDVFRTISRQNLTTLGNADSDFPAFSADGKALAFLSRASNLTNDTPTPTPPVEAFVALMTAAPALEQLLLVSTSGGGIPANAADGDVASVALGGVADAGLHLRAVFATQATNLGGTSTQAYVRDISTGTTSLINRAAGAGGVPGDAFSLQPAVSADGSAVSYTTRSTNLGDGAVAGQLEVDLRRLPSETLEVVSRPDGTGPLPPNTGDASVAGNGVSAGGRFVLVTAQSPSLSPDDDDRFQSVFVRDLLTNRTELMSRASGAGGAPANESSAALAISDDGRRVLFQSSATNLTPDPTNGVLQVFVRDRTTGTTTLVSRANGPTGASATLLAGSGDISADARVAVFATRSALDPAGADGAQHLYARDLDAATTTLVDRDSGVNGAVQAVNAQEPSISGDGTHVVWDSAATLAGAPADAHFHLFVRDLVAHTTTLVSRAEGLAGASANQDVRTGVLDADGGVVAFSSFATNLGVPPVNSLVFVREIATGHLQVVSRNTGATGSLPSSANAPSIDAAGDRVAFFASGLEGSTAGHNQVYVRDLADQTTTLASRADGPSGEPADGDALFPSLDASGDCVAFTTTASNLGDGFGSFDVRAAHLRVLRRECPFDPPDTTVTDGPSGPTADATPTFAFTSNDTAATFECHLEAQSFAPCTSPLTTPALADGAHTLTVRAVDPAGNADPSPATRDFTVDTRPPVPVLSALKLTPKRFHVGGKKGGTTITFTLTLAARVTLRFDRLTAGHKKGKRCLPGFRKGQKRCTIARAKGSLGLNGKKGKNSLKFTGKLGRKALPPGSYRLTATPKTGKARTFAFTVVAR